MAGKIADSVLDLIGGTPLVRLRRLADAGGARVLAKVESRNPGGSVNNARHKRETHEPGGRAGFRRFHCRTA